MKPFNLPKNGSLTNIRIEGRAFMDNYQERSQRTGMNELPVLFSMPGPRASQRPFLLENISFSGAYLVTREKIPVKSRASIRFTLPFDHLALVAESGVNIEVCGIVIRKGKKGKEPAGIGIRFEETPTLKYKPLV